MHASLHRATRKSVCSKPLRRQASGIRSTHEPLYLRVLYRRRKPFLIFLILPIKRFLFAIFRTLQVSSPKKTQSAFSPNTSHLTAAYSRSTLTAIWKRTSPSAMNGGDPHRFHTTKTATASTNGALCAISALPCRFRCGTVKSNTEIIRRF